MGRNNPFESEGRSRNEPHAFSLNSLALNAIQDSALTFSLKYSPLRDSRSLNRDSLPYGDRYYSSSDSTDEGTTVTSLGVDASAVASNALRLSCCAVSTGSSVLSEVIAW